MSPVHRLLHINLDTTRFGVVNGQNSFTVPAGCDYTITPEAYQEPGTPDPKKWKAQPVSTSLNSGGSASASVVYQPAFITLNLTVKKVPGFMDGEVVNFSIGGRAIDSITLSSSRDSTYTYTLDPTTTTGAFEVQPNSFTQGNRTYVADFQPTSLSNVAAGSTVDVTLTFNPDTGNIRLQVNHWFAGAVGQTIPINVELYRSNDLNNCLPKSNAQPVLTDTINASSASTEKTYNNIGSGRYQFRFTTGWGATGSASTARCTAAFNVNKNNTTTVFINYLEDLGLLKLSIDRRSVTFDGNTYNGDDNASFTDYYIFKVPGTYRLSASNYQEFICAGLFCSGGYTRYWLPYNQNPAPSTATSQGVTLNEDVSITAKILTPKLVNYAGYKWVQICTRRFFFICISSYWELQKEVE